VQLRRAEDISCAAECRMTNGWPLASIIFRHVVRAEPGCRLQFACSKLFAKDGTNELPKAEAMIGSIGVVTGAPARTNQLPRATRRIVRLDFSVEIRCCSFRGTTIENFWTTARPFTKIVVITPGKSPA